jgi:hypothetical protein
MYKILAFACAVMAMLLVGCASMTTIHTAETLPQGSSTYYVAYVPSSAPLLDTNSDGKADNMAFNTIEGGVRLGLSNHWEIGAKLYPIGLLIDGKYQFITGNLFKAAGDLGAGYMTITSGKSSTSIIDIVPEVPLTIRPFSWGAFTLAPKSLIRIVSSSDDSTDKSSSSTQFLIGVTAGLKFTVGNIGSMIFEYGAFGGSYSSNHFALAVERPLFGKSHE